MLRRPIPSVQPGPDQRGQSVARRPVSVLFGALEALGVDRQDGYSLLGFHAAADCRHVVADDPHDAGRVDECGLGMVGVDQLHQSPVQFLLAPENHVLLSQVGRETHAVQLGARGEGPANVPRIGRAPDRTVDQVYGVGDRVEHDPRPAKNAGALAHRPGQALPLAGHRERLGAFLVDLRFAGFEDLDRHGKILHFLHHQFKALFGRLAVLAVHQSVQDHFQQPDRALVTDGREVGMANAVENRESMPDEGNVLVGAMYLP